VTERDANGRFVKGEYKGGPGRPKKKREERYLEITLNTVTFEKWKKIIEKAAEQAARGDKDARKFLAEYLLGKPDNNLNLNGLINLTWPEETETEY